MIELIQEWVFEYIFISLAFTVSILSFMFITMDSEAEFDAIFNEVTLFGQILLILLCGPGLIICWIVYYILEISVKIFKYLFVKKEKK